MNGITRKSKIISAVLLSVLLVIFSAIFMSTTAFAAKDESGMIKAYPAITTADFQKYKSDIVSVTFLNALDEASINAADTLDKWDVSALGDKSVMAWIKGTADLSKYDLYISADGGVKANTDSSNLFSQFTSLESINGIENFDTSAARDMSYMFYGCGKLTRLDLSKLDVQNVENMTSMFSAYKDTQGFWEMNLSELNLSGWNTKKLETIDEMFYGCISLNSLNISGCNLNNLKNYSETFTRCGNLKVEAANTSLSQFSYKLFSGTDITSLNLSNSTITSVTLNKMFAGCKNLGYINLSDVKHNAQNTSEMFLDCTALNDPILKNFSTENVSDMSYMFANCSNIHVLDLSSFTTNYEDKSTNLHRTIDMTCMFYNCLSLNKIIIDTEKWVLDQSRTYGRDMFTNCYVIRGEKGFGYSESQTDENFATTKYYLTSVEKSDSQPSIPDNDDDDYNEDEIPGKDQIDQGISFFEKILQWFRMIMSFLFFL